MEIGDELLSTDYTHLKYYYGIDNQRRKMIEDRFDAGVQSSHRVKYYSGNFESETINLAGVVSSREINYIFAPDGLAAIYEMKNGTGKMYYVSTDNLGSINMIADAQGNIVNDLSYDAWGRRRDAYTWETLTTTQLKTLQPTLITDRGYTMHEHMDAFGLVNMNGRAYDPLVGQFLSPDPFVQAGEYTQSYNRYSYCWNNPLKYSDPSGYATINLDGLLFSMNSNWRFYQFLGDNWDNIATLSSSNGMDFTWGEMQDMQGSLTAGRNYLHERGIWYETHFWSSSTSIILNRSNKKNIIEFHLQMPTLTVSCTFISAEDFFRGIDELGRFAGGEFGGLDALENKADPLVTYGAGSLAVGLDSYAKSIYNAPSLLSNGTWKGLNNKVYSWSVLGNKSNPSWGLLKNSQEIAASRTFLARSIGKGIGYASLIYSGVMFVNNPTLANGLDLSVSAIAIAIPEIGFFYIVGSMMYQHSLNTYNSYLDHGMLQEFNPMEGLSYQWAIHGKE